MAATMKHRRSASKRKKARGANRYDKLLTKFKKIKLKGGSLARRSHMVTPKNPTYKGVKVLQPEK